MVSHSDDQAARGDRSLGQDESDHSLEPQLSQEPEELVSKFYVFIATTVATSLVVSHHMTTPVSSHVVQLFICQLTDLSLQVRNKN